MYSYVRFYIGSLRYVPPPDLLLGRWLTRIPYQVYTYIYTSRFRHLFCRAECIYAIQYSFCSSVTCKCAQRNYGRTPSDNPTQPRGTTPEEGRNHPGYNTQKRFGGLDGGNLSDYNIQKDFTSSWRNENIRQDQVLLNIRTL